MWGIHRAILSLFHLGLLLVVILGCHTSRGKPKGLQKIPHTRSTYLFASDMPFSTVWVQSGATRGFVRGRRAHSNSGWGPTHSNWIRLVWVATYDNWDNSRAKKCWNFSSETEVVRPALGSELAETIWGLSPGRSSPDLIHKTHPTSKSYFFLTWPDLVLSQY